MDLMRERLPILWGALLCLGPFACSDSDVALGERVKSDSSTDIEDAGMSSADARARTSDAAFNDAAFDDEVCAFADAVVTQRSVTVWLVVEGSSIMHGSVMPTPWQRAGAALVGDGGLVARAGSNLKFGVIRHGDDRSSPTCPKLRVVEPALNNQAPIAAALEAIPLPRDTSMASYALDRVLSSASSAASLGPLAVIMVRHSNAAFDYVCDSDPPEMTTAERTYAAARRIADLGAPIFVVDFLNLPSFDGIDKESDKLAQIGGTGDMAYHVPWVDDGTANAALESALNEIARRATSCDFGLDGRVTAGKECEGSVSLDGRAIPCNGENGWRLKDESTVELIGDACESLRGSKQSKVSARFPCDIYIAI